LLATFKAGLPSQKNHILERKSDCSFLNPWLHTLFAIAFLDSDRFFMVKDWVFGASILGDFLLL
jgi:hypothetical protein